MHRGHKIEMENTNPFSYSEYLGTKDNSLNQNTGIRITEFDITYSGNNRPDPNRISGTQMMRRSHRSESIADCDSDTDAEEVVITTRKSSRTTET